MIGLYDLFIISWRKNLNVIRLSIFSRVLGSGAPGILIGRGARLYSEHRAGNQPDCCSDADCNWPADLRKSLQVLLEVCVYSDGYSILNAVETSRDHSMIRHSLHSAPPLNSLDGIFKNTASWVSSIYYQGKGLQVGPSILRIIWALTSGPVSNLGDSFSTIVLPKANSKCYPFRI